MRITTVLLVFASTLMIACKSKKQVVEAVPPPPPPGWVAERPVSSVYYVGIGIANKTLGAEDYKQIAKRNALQDLASEIKVNVSGNSVLYSLENNQGFKEEFMQTTKLSSSLNLEGYEQSGVYENDESYFVYYKLSKAKYQQLRNEKITAAIELSKQNRSQALQHVEAGNYAQAIKGYYKALGSLQEFLNEPLKANVDGSEVFYGNHLVQEIQKLANELTIKPQLKSYIVTQGSVVPTEKTVFEIVDAKGKQQQGLDVQFKMGDEVLLIDKATSDHNGQVFSSVGRMKVAGRSALTATVYVVTSKTKDKLLSAVVSGVQWPTTAMTIEVTPPRIYLEVEHTADSKKLADEPIRLSFSEAAVSNGFLAEQDKGKANLYAKIVLNAKENGVYQGLYTVLMSGYISILDPKSGKEIFRESFDGLKGVDLDFKRAQLKGMDAFKKRLVYETVPRFRRKCLD